MLMYRQNACPFVMHEEPNGLDTLKLGYLCMLNRTSCLNLAWLHRGIAMRDPGREVFVIHTFQQKVSPSRISEWVTLLNIRIL
ncbi:hypothetical protein FKM82_030501 [Ascaphus truei]